MGQGPHHASRAGSWEPSSRASPQQDPCRNRASRSAACRGGWGWVWLIFRPGGEVQLRGVTCGGSGHAGVRPGSSDHGSPARREVARDLDSLEGFRRLDPDLSSPGGHPGEPFGERGLAPQAEDAGGLAMIAESHPHLVCAGRCFTRWPGWPIARATCSVSSLTE